MWSSGHVVRQAIDLMRVLFYAHSGIYIDSTIACGFNVPDATWHSPNVVYVWLKWNLLNNFEE